MNKEIKRGDRVKIKENLSRDKDLKNMFGKNGIVKFNQKGLIFVEFAGDEVSRFLSITQIEKV